MLSKQWGGAKVLAITGLVVMLLATFTPVVDAQQRGQSQPPTGQTLPPALMAAVMSGNMSVVTRTLTVLSDGNAGTFGRLAQLAFEQMASTATARGLNPVDVVRDASIAFVREAARMGGEDFAINMADRLSASAVSTAQRLSIDPSQMANGVLAGAQQGATLAGVNVANVVAGGVQGAQRAANALGITLTLTTTTPTTVTTGTTASSATTTDTSATTATTATTLTTFTTFTTLTTVTTQTTVTTLTTLTTVTTQTTVTTSSTTTTLASPSARLPQGSAAGPLS